MNFKGKKREGRKRKEGEGRIGKEGGGRERKEGEGRGRKEGHGSRRKEQEGIGRKDGEGKGKRKGGRGKLGVLHPLLKGPGISTKPPSTHGMHLTRRDSRSNAAGSFTGMHLYVSIIPLTRLLC